MMTVNNHNELIDHIREVLQEHREFCPPGAWKEFQQHKRKRTGALVAKITMGIAASVLLLLSLDFMVSNSGEAISPKATVVHQEGEPPKADSSKRKTSVSSLPLPESVSAAIAQKEKPRHMPPNKTDDTSRGHKPHISMVQDTPPAVAGKDQQLKPAPAFPEISPFQAKAVVTPAQITPATGAWPVVTEDSRPAGPEPDNPFSFGVAYTSLINANGAKTDWSMGGGIFTDWNFAGDFALSSGVFVAQNQLKYRGGGNAEGIQTENLAYVQVDLVSLEVPLSLKYYVSDHISVSAGISSSAFLKENYNYTYQYQREIRVTTFQEGTIQPLVKEITVTESQKRSEPSFNSVNWAAFYTFSLAYRFDISDRNMLSLEPFVKLPSGRLTSRELSYSTGGLQLKISF